MTRRTKLLSLGAMTLALGIVILFIAGRIEATRAATIVRYDLRSGKRCAQVPQKFAVLGDLHISEQTTPPAALSEAVRRINAQKPDYVLLVGDYLDESWPHDPAGIAAALAPLRNLRARVGTAAVLGNNDWQGDQERIAAALRATGVHVLRNSAWLTPDAVVLGVEELISNTANPVLAQERYTRARKAHRLAAPPIEIWMAHEPTMFDRMPSSGDLLVVGHTHGGQILPRITVPMGRIAIRLLRAWGYVAGWPAETYVRGVYSRGDRRMLVTSGIGVSALPIRIGVPPEIAIAHIDGCRR